MSKPNNTKTYSLSEIELRIILMELKYVLQGDCLTTAGEELYHKLLKELTQG